MVEVNARQVFVPTQVLNAALSRFLFVLYLWICSSFPSLFSLSPTLERSMASVQLWSWAFRMESILIKALLDDLNKHASVLKYV